MFEERYREIVRAVDAEFARNCALHGDRIHCRPGCTDCCHQIFPITEIEAGEVSRAVQRLNPEARNAMQARARFYIEERLLRGTQLPCPALEHGACSIYEFRPLMCHKFGMPMYNPEKPDRIFACELNFNNGESIEDPSLIQIQTGIHEDWKQLKADYREAYGQGGSGHLTVAHAILRSGGPGSE